MITLDHKSLFSLSRLASPRVGLWRVEQSQNPNPHVLTHILAVFMTHGPAFADLTWDLWSHHVCFGDWIALVHHLYFVPYTCYVHRKVVENLLCWFKYSFNVDGYIYSSNKYDLINHVKSQCHNLLGYETILKQSTLYTSWIWINLVTRYLLTQVSAVLLSISFVYVTN